MGWLSKTFKKAKNAVSDAWSGAKDAVRDVTGVDSINSLIATGGLAMVPANLNGQGFLGEALKDAISPLLAQPNQMPPASMMQGYGPLSQPAPAMSMGTGAAPDQSSSGDIASLFGESGYSYGPSQTSTALLQANPEAYQFNPLFSTV